MPFLLSTEELATLWHPATLTVRAPGMTTVETRELEPPVHLPTPEWLDDYHFVADDEFQRVILHEFGPRCYLRCLRALG